MTHQNVPVGKCWKLLWATLNNSKTRLFVLYLKNYAARALPILFNTPKKSLLKSSYLLKKYLPKFRTQKNAGNKNFKPPKILRSSPSPGLLPSLAITSIPPVQNWVYPWSGNGSGTTTCAWKHRGWTCIYQWRIMNNHANSTLAENEQKGTFYLHKKIRYNLLSSVIGQTIWIRIP